MRTLFHSILLTFFTAGLLKSQTVPVPLPDLRLSTYGQVHTIAVQKNGKILIGGIFNSVNDIPRSNIARLNPDGSLDFSWAPQLDGPCHGLMIDDGDLYLAGDFSSINGEPFEDFAKVSLINGAVDLQLSRNVFDQGNPFIRALAQNETHIFAGGGNGLIRKISKATGEPDASWVPIQRSQPVEVLLQDGPWIFAGFGNAGLGKISAAAATEDRLFTAPLDIHASDLARDNKEALIVVPGFFQDHPSPEESEILPAKLSSVSGLQDRSWQPSVTDNRTAASDINFESKVSSVAIHKGWVYLGGKFLSLHGDTDPYVTSPNGNSIARVELTNPGTGDLLWTPGIGSGDGDNPTEPFPVFDLLATPQGILVGGAIGTIDGRSRLGMSRIKIDTGSLDLTLPVQVQAQGASVQAIATQEDGKLVIGGNFLFVNGVERQHLARFNPDGNLDQGWVSNCSLPVTDLAVGGNHLIAALKLEDLLEVEIDDGNQSLIANFVSNDPIAATFGSVVANEDYVYFTHGGIALPPSQKRSISGRPVGWLPISQPGGQGEVEEVLATDGSDLFVFYRRDSNFLSTKFVRHYSDDGDAGMIWETAIGSESSPIIWINDIKADRKHVYLCGPFDLIGNAQVDGLARLFRDTGELDPSWTPFLGPGPPPSAIALTDSGAWILRDGKVQFVSKATGEVGNARIATPDFQSIELPELSGSFTTTFTLTPNEFQVAGFIGLSDGPAASLNDMAAIIRLRPDGTVQARNGSTYQAENFFNYVKWLPYLVEMNVDLISQTYSVILIPDGGQPVVIAKDYEFTPSQAGIGQLNHLSTIATIGSHILDNVNPIKNPGSTLLEPQVIGPIRALHTNSRGLYLGGDFQFINDIPTSDIGLITLAGAPVVGIGPDDRILVGKDPGNTDEITHFQISGIIGGSLFHADGVKPIQNGDFINIGQGLMGLVWVPAVGGGPQQFLVRAALAPGADAVGSQPTLVEPGSPSLLPLIHFERLRTTEFEDVGGIEVSVRYSGSQPASVDVTIFKGSANPVIYGPSPLGDFFDPGTHTLNFTEPGVQSIIIALWDDDIVEGDEIFYATLSNPVGALLGDTSTAQMRIIENDVFGGSEPGVSSPPDAQPTADGVLEVNLSDDSDQGEWRLVGEVAWRAASDDGGDPAIGLVSGNYEIEFAPIDGYLEPSRITVPIDGMVASPVQVDAAYADVDILNPGIGTLKVNIGPDAIADAVSDDDRGQWRRQGEADWRDDGDEASVDSGLQIIEFKTVDGRITPTTRSILVQEGQINSSSGTYLVKSDISGARDTEPLVFAGDPRDLSDPYKFAGQIATEQGFGSGVVTQEHTVLTAAHVIFDDNELAYVDEVFWFFQRHKGDFEPPSMTPRGWYVFDGYADQRAIDVANPAFGPGVGSVDSQNEDAAVLYFLEPAGRNGFGGYQVSESTANKWLLGNADKFMVGYPVEETPETDQGRMHATTKANDRYNFEEEFVWSTQGIQSNPGSSGGPVYVDTGAGAYFPVAIYLGGSGDTTVRAINNNVVNLMNLAETAGSGGGNSTGGGATYVSEGFTDDEFSRGFITVNIHGSDAGQWRVVDAGGTVLSDYMDSGVLFEITPGSLILELEPLDGLEESDATMATVFDGQITEKEMAYIDSIDDWLQRELTDHGIVTEDGILDDYDEDGLVHLIELAFNLSPRDADQHVLTEGTGEDGLPSIRFDPDTGKLRVEYVRRKAGVTPGLEYSVEFATDPAGPWTAFTGDEDRESIDDTWERIIVLADETLDSTPKYFGRLRITVDTPD